MLYCRISQRTAQRSGVHCTFAFITRKQTRSDRPCNTWHRESTSRWKWTALLKSPHWGWGNSRTGRRPSEWNLCNALAVKHSTCYRNCLGPAVRNKPGEERNSGWTFSSKYSSASKCAAGQIGRFYTELPSQISACEFTYCARVNCDSSSVECHD